MGQDRQVLAPKVYNEFRIEVRPSPETNDHQVRFIADSLDIISGSWHGMIGLDPDDILFSPCPIAPTDAAHKAIVARCSCGVIGCDSIEVEIAQFLDVVQWRWGNPNSPQSLSFLAVTYNEEVRRALTDTSWETPDRTAARLLSSAIDREALSRNGLAYNWASGRVRKETFTIAMTLVEPVAYQVLVHIPWVDEPAEAIARKSADVLMEQPNDWANVEWFPQQPDLCKPSLAGSGSGRQEWPIRTGRRTLPGTPFDGMTRDEVATNRRLY